MTLALAACAPPAVRVTQFRDFASDQTVTPFDWQPYAEKYEGSDAVILESTTDAEHHVHLGHAGQLINWDYFENRSVRYVILDVENDEYARFTERVPKGRVVTNVKLRVTAPDGRVQTYSSADMSTKRDEHGRMTYKFIYPQLQKGSVIEQRMEIKESNPGLATEIPVQFSVPCEKVTARFAYPADWKHALKSTSPGSKPAVQRTLSTDGKTAIVTYRATDVTPIHDEPFSPPFNDMAQYLAFDFESIAGTKIYGTWGEFSKRISKRFIDNDSLFSNRLEKTTRNITDGLEPGEDKPLAIVKWVQDNIEVSSQSTTLDFAQILKSGKADPMMMTGLVVKMLQTAGTRAQMGLIHSAEDGYFDYGFISPSQFYIPCAVTFKEDKPYRVFFPFIPQLPIGHIPASFQGQTALLFEQNGANFVKIPLLDEGGGMVEEHYSVEIEDSGYLNVVEQKVIHGANAFALRQFLKEMDEPEVEELIKDLISYEGGEVTINRKEILGRDKTDEPLRFELEYRIDNLVTVTPDEVLFATAGLFSPISKTKIKVIPSERTNPVHIVDPQHFRKHIEITFPDKWVLESRFDPVTVLNSFGQLQTGYEYAPGKFHAELDLRLNRVHAPVTSFGQLVNLIGSEELKGFAHLVFGIEGE
ncbi:MAG: DUF3857 domain-containing protein [Acidobacteria bacterium]|nr:DUF3857 domain-containing protein [Acidobacteriota bacterium]